MSHVVLAWYGSRGQSDLELSDMAWTEPQYSRQEVDEAGKTLIGYISSLAETPSEGAYEEAFEHALEVINNWRSSHSYPLNTFQVWLRKNARGIDSRAIVAQRIKRLSSIDAKLVKLNWLRLSEMQDIGGCRAVVDSVRRVDELVALYKKSELRHVLDDEDDYIRKPKKSGYRGIHLIYRYQSDRKTTYNNLKIEVQLRSPLQHAWATAVETVGTFIRQALKASRGEKEWLRFFALMGSALALREKTAIVPGTPANRGELKEQLRKYATELDVDARLRAYGAMLKTLEQPSAGKAHYFLLALDPAAKRVTVTGYRARDLEKASTEYLDTERSFAERPGAEAVLVSVESLSSLRRAYPNYFLDTTVFLEALKKAVR